MAVVFTERELDIMAVLREHGPSTVAEVRSRRADPMSQTAELRRIRAILDERLDGTDAATSQTRKRKS